MRETRTQRLKETERPGGGGGGQASRQVPTEKPSPGDSEGGRGPRCPSAGPPFPQGTPPCQRCPSLVAGVGVQPPSSALPALPRPPQAPLICEEGLACPPQF